MPDITTRVPVRLMPLLLGLFGACRCVASVYGFCWNNHFNNTKPDGPPADITVVLSQNMSCPTTPAELQQLNADLQQISQSLSQASGGIIASVDWSRYTPGLCTQVSTCCLWVVC